MTAPQPPETFQYVYGVIRAGTRVPDGLNGLDDKSVSAVSHGRCAALVSELKREGPLGDRADLAAHHHVLDAFVSADIGILPFRFGAVLNSREAVERELLAENGERLAQTLDRLEGRREIRVKGVYVKDAVLREVMAEEPQVAKLNERLRGIPAEAAHYDRIRLGELVAESVKHRRDHDAARLLEILTPAATAVAPHTPVREEDVLDASFLVEREKLPDFQQAVEKLGHAHQDRIQLRLIGPLPPYDFVPEE